MSSFRFPLVAGRPAAEVFADIPSSAASFLRQGFALLTRVSPQYYRTLVDKIAETIDFPTLLEDEALAEDIGVKDDISPLVGAVSMLIVSLSLGKETPEEIASAAAAAKLLSDADRSSFIEVARAITQQRASLSDALRRSRTATRVLPSLMSFSSSVELRFGFNKGEPAYTVPIVVAHIDTDAAHEELWFQMSESQLKYLAEALQDAVKRLDKAKAWAERAK